jgi:hypothetical protein
LSKIATFRAPSASRLSSKRCTAVCCISAKVSPILDTGLYIGHIGVGRTENSADTCWSNRTWISPWLGLGLQTVKKKGKYSTDVTCARRRSRITGTVGEVDFPLSSRFRFLFTRAPSYSACTASVTSYRHSLLRSSPAAMRIPIKLPRVLPGIRAIPQAMRLRARRQGVNQINCCVLSPPLATSAPLDSFDLADRCACVGPKDKKKQACV